MRFYVVKYMHPPRQACIDQPSMALVIFVPCKKNVFQGMYIYIQFVKLYIYRTLRVVKRQLLFNNHLKMALFLVVGDSIGRCGPFRLL